MLMIKLTPKQQDYIRNANHRWNIKVGAVRSGKSYIDTLYTIPYRLRERTGKDGLNAIIGVSRETIERNVLQPMREHYGNDLIGTINSRNIAMVCGEPVYCLGAEKCNQVSKVQGSSLKYVYGDEVAKWHKDVFTMLQSRLDKSYSCFDGALNPEQPTHWLLPFLNNKDIDIYVQKYTIFDNPFLPKKFVDSLCKEYEGTIYYNRLILGEWVRAEGAIYRAFADNPQKFKCVVGDTVQGDIKTFKKSELKDITIGLDFGGNKSGHALVATAHTADYKDLVVLKSGRYFGDYDSVKLEQLVADFCTSIEDKYGKIITLYYDNAETVLGTGVKNKLAKTHPHIVVRGARKSAVNGRIQATIRLINAGRMWLSDGCDSLSTALQQAVWSDKAAKDERLDDGSSDIDSLDAFEYSFERDIRRYITV